MIEKITLAILTANVSYSPEKLVLTYNPDLPGTRIFDTDSLNEVIADDLSDAFIHSGIQKTLKVIGSKNELIGALHTSTIRSNARIVLAPYKGNRLNLDEDFNYYDGVVEVTIRRYPNPGLIDIIERIERNQRDYT